MAKEKGQIDEIRESEGNIYHRSSVKNDRRDSV